MYFIKNLYSTRFLDLTYVVTVKSAHQHFRIIAGTALQKYKGWDILQ
jgi:hypothetical protein